MSRRYRTVDLRESKKMIDHTPYVFVYGTLKRSRGNNRLLVGADFVGADTTAEGWLLGDVGVPYAFPPAIVPEKFKALLRPIKGELFRLNRLDTAYFLDCLEGYDPDKEKAHYWRRIIETTGGYTAWIYTSEDFTRAFMCDASPINEQGEWEW